MFIIAQWIRKWRKQRQLLEERKKLEAERQIQREKKDSEYGQALQLILNALQRTMDPLIASQAYNNRFCPLTRLPEELLLNVLDFLRGDDVTLCCLRITSRVFLRLLHDESTFWTLKPICGFPFALGQGLPLRFRRILQRDERCENCRRWNNAHVRSSLDPCKFKGDFLRRTPRFFGREYWYTDYGRPHCSACGTDHDACQFPLAYQQPPRAQYRGPQLCLGQQGSVQLCEHVHIAWSTINAHIDDWRQKSKKGGESGKAGREADWQACLDSFNIECHDPTHDTRCTASNAPTWPRARLGTSSGLWFQDPDIVVLYLEWTPHGRIDALIPTADERIPASELRALFRRFRRMGPADVLYPPGRPEALPEMACFTPSFPIYYEMKEQEEGNEDAEKRPPPPPPPSFAPPSSNQRELSLHCRSIRSRPIIGQNSQRLEIRPHYLSDANNNSITSQCLTVSYQKAIMVCQTKALTDPAVKLIPSHHWLHAMDPRTYHHQQAGQFRPQCRDESCTNYYRRTKVYYSCD